MADPAWCQYLVRRKGLLGVSIWYIITKTKTMTWFYEGLSDGVDIYKLLPFMEDKIIN